MSQISRPVRQRREYSKQIACRQQMKKWAYVIKNVPIKIPNIKREILRRKNLKFCECIFHANGSFDSSVTTDFI